MGSLQFWRNVTMRFSLQQVIWVRWCCVPSEFHSNQFPPRMSSRDPAWWNLTSFKKDAWYSTLVLRLLAGECSSRVAGDQGKTTFATVLGHGVPMFEAAWCSLVSFVHDYLLIYLDDVIVYSPDFQSPDHLEAIFQCLSDHGLKLYRCRLFQQGDKYLGRVVG